MSVKQVAWSFFGDTTDVPTPPDIKTDAFTSGDAMLDGVGGEHVAAYAQLLTYAQTIANILIGISVIWLLINFVVMAVQLAQAGDNPGMRQKCVDNFKRNLFAIAILGGISTIVSICLGAFIPATLTV